MSDNSHVELYIESIKSNTSKLSGHIVHDAAVNLVRNEAIFGEIMLKALVPKHEGFMAEAAGHKGPFDDGTDVFASVGIPEIHKPNESDPFSAKYPEFVAKGTGLFGDEPDYIFAKRDKGFMYIPPERSDRGGGFLFKSKGQEGKPFMRATYESMVEALKINGELFKAELSSKMKSDTLS